MKKIKKKLIKVFDGKEKVVPLHSQNTGNGAEGKERVFAKFFERMIQAKSER